MAQYARRTTVPAEKTRTEIEKLLDKYGATAFGYSRNLANVVIEFSARQRHIRFLLPMPALAEKRFWIHNGRKRGLTEATNAHDQACRSRWRSLLLIIKAKLEAVEDGIETFESIFLANIVNPATNRTVGEVLLPELEKLYGPEPDKTLRLTLTTERVRHAGEHVIDAEFEKTS